MAEKKSKKKKTRTIAKFRNFIIQGIKTSFTKYHPNYQIVKDRARVSLPRYNKDGSRHKVDSVWYLCAKCQELVKDVDIDHVFLIVPVTTTAKNMSWDEIVDRTDCELEDLQCLCENCHLEKSNLEKEQRKKNKCVI